ncbi:MAG: hemerythrin domain-containing protein [Deltaproteobacteria bacterium]|nr:hemerythrin domain-containing protein [Deltaproteobacteria bacterium]
MPNAAQLLRQDHKKVEGLFHKFEQAKSAQTKRRIAETAMSELEAHAAIEEEIFYPAVKSEVGSSMTNEAFKEHKTVKNLIQELKNSDGDGEDFETKFAELMENVKHHVEEEEGEMLPQVEESEEIDLKALGEKMAGRKRELMGNGKGRSSRSTRKKK